MSKSSYVTEAPAVRVRVTKGWSGSLLRSDAVARPFVATREAESFITLYLVPKFDKTSFIFSL